MNLEVQYKLRVNPNSLKYLKENSYWYKYLNRNKFYLQKFEEEMKQKYKLTTTDKINKMAKNIDMILKIMDILN